MEKCSCYGLTRKLKGWLDAETPIYGEQYGVCNGTKERERCSCNGNKLKCDFYDYIRERAEKETLEYKIEEAKILLEKNGYEVRKK